MVKEFTVGPMEENMTENGKIIKCTAEEFSLGVMEEGIHLIKAIMASMKTIRNKVKANSLGRTVKNIMYFL